jgi:hypothetical protein
MAYPYRYKNTSSTPIPFAGFGIVQPGEIVELGYELRDPLFEKVNEAKKIEPKAEVKQEEKPKVEKVEDKK